MKYYSESEQDKWAVEEVYKYKRNGYFIELGAGNGRRQSCTMCLEKDLDWQGICIEPNPRFHNKLRKLRNCIVDTSLIFSESGKTVTFHPRGYMSGIDGFINSRAEVLAEKYEEKFDSIELETSTLEEVLDKHDAPQFIDIMTLDTEGSEYEIMKHFPFNKYIFGLIFVEISPDTIDQVVELFVSKGYIKHDRFKNDIAFMHPSVASQYYRSRPIKYHGLKQQDKWVIEEMFGYFMSGYFVDIGCSDGIKHSNTYMLEKKYGWDGVCIDGNERYCEMARRRRNVPVVNAVLDKEERTVIFGKAKREKGGIKEYSSCGCRLSGEKSVETTTIGQVLRDIAAPKIISFVSLDVEGAEVPILETFPFDEYWVKVFIVDYDNNEEKKKQIDDIMTAHGYGLEKQGKFDLYYA